MRDGISSLLNTLRRVVRDGVLADEQPLADLRVRQPVSGEARDLRFLSCELRSGLEAALLYVLACGHERALGPRCERLDRPAGPRPLEKSIEHSAFRLAVLEHPGAE